MGNKHFENETKKQLHFTLASEKNKMGKEDGSAG